MVSNVQVASESYSSKFFAYRSYRGCINQKNLPRLANGQPLDSVLNNHRADNHL
jgi:hypothetical protein